MNRATYAQTHAHQHLLQGLPYQLQLTDGLCH